MDLLRSLPIGLYLEQPVSWLHRVDPRVKSAWLVSFLLTPVAANLVWRSSLVLVLLLLMVSTLIPFRVWWRQMGLVLGFGLLLFFVTLVAPDGLNVRHQPRQPAHELTITQPPATQPSSLGETLAPTLENLPQPTDYQFVLFDQGIVRVTRRSLTLAIRLATLVFTLLVSTNLFLLTTAPEEITAGLDHLLQPLRRFGVPVTEIVLTLTLSLRFIPLVLEEVQNLVRSVRTRAINWKKLGFRGSSQVWLVVAERMVDNLLLRAEQIASAMQVRGFTSPNQHRVRWHQLRLRWVDAVALLGLVAFWGARTVWGGM
ncbi:MAG TPA: energy-coupling factor transporter transmembrane protein EcfT [Synechococcales cyanobacterium M55_K2018_004]|nr:energy-coupling factor transporter transmembrane protein EcfT [Synechococcales cyanobacterium M55_K2018_004]